MSRIPVSVPFPTPPRTEKEVVEWAGNLQRAVMAALRRIQEPRGPEYTPSNVTPLRTIDADTIILTDLADVVGTLLADLRDEGIVREA